MTGPYEHVRESTGLRMLRGRIELEQEGQKVVATVLGGEATLELVEQFDDAITAFGQDQPVRFVGRRNKLRLLVECDLDQMVITTEPAG